MFVDCSNLNLLEISKIILNCKMFMFFCAQVNLDTVSFKDCNLTLSKFINCKKINTDFSGNNKILSLYQKNDKGLTL